MPSNSVLVPLPNSGGSCTNYPPSRLFGAHLIGDTPHPCQDESGAYPCQELPNPGVHGKKCLNVDQQRISPKTRQFSSYINSGIIQYLTFNKCSSCI